MFVTISWAGLVFGSSDGGENWVLKKDFTDYYGDIDLYIRDCFYDEENHNIWLSIDDADTVVDLWVSQNGGNDWELNQDLSVSGANRAGGIGRDRKSKRIMAGTGLTTVAELWYRDDN